mmetsp:Transcript_28907/g.72601  ORF Transcript_28907/g.72601 Transcript_28907/m.72601 type:complete len:235 (-) Transcript_28907:196-900(-)
MIRWEKAFQELAMYVGADAAPASGERPSRSRLPPVPGSFPPSNLSTSMPAALPPPPSRTALPSSEAAILWSFERGTSASSRLPLQRPPITGGASMSDAAGNAGAMQDSGLDVKARSSPRAPSTESSIPSSSKSIAPECAPLLLASPSPDPPLSGLIPAPSKLPSNSSLFPAAALFPAPAFSSRSNTSASPPLTLRRSPMIGVISSSAARIGGTRRRAARVAEVCWAAAGTRVTP